MIQSIWLGYFLTNNFKNLKNKKKTIHECYVMRKMLAIEIVKWVCIWDFQVQSALLMPGMQCSTRSFGDRIVDKWRRIIRCRTHWTINIAQNLSTVTPKISLRMLGPKKKRNNLRKRTIVRSIWTTKSHWWRRVKYQSMILRRMIYTKGGRPNSVLHFW